MLIAITLNICVLAIFHYQWPVIFCAWFLSVFLDQGYSGRSVIVHCVPVEVTFSTTQINVNVYHFNYVYNPLI